MISEKVQIDELQSATNVSRETIEKLKAYEGLIQKWNPAINLISKSTLDEIWRRHFLDSAQLWSLKPTNANKWLDLGSGGGFPGLVIAAIANEQAPELRVSLVESDHRKAAFLQTVRITMGITVEIHTCRIEDLDPQAADVISARALAPLSELLRFADQHRAEKTICLFSKGKNTEIELTEAKKYWTFDTQKIQSATSSSSKILKIGEFGRVKPK